MSQQNDIVSPAAPSVAATSDWMGSASSENMNQSHDFRISPIIDEFRQDDHSDIDMDDELDKEAERELMTYGSILVTGNKEPAVTLEPPDITADSPSLPCGCFSTDMDIYSANWYGPQLFAPWYPRWSDERIIENKQVLDETIITQDGIRERSMCYCPVDSIDCMACGPLNVVLRDLYQHGDFLHLSITEFLDALEHNGYFDIHFNIIDKRDDFGFPQSDVFLCLKYKGPMYQPTTYHLLTNFSPFLDRTVWVGPLGSTDIYKGRYDRHNIRLPTVINNEQPISDCRLHQPMRLDIAAALQVSRIPTDNYPSWLKRILQHTLEPFKSGDSYYLPLLADSGGRCNPAPARNNLKPVQVATARGDEDTSVGERSIVQDQQHNVDLAETTEQSETYVATEPFDILPWITEEKHEYPDLTGRWTKAFSFQWTTTQPQGPIAYRFDLPIEAIQSFRNAPNALPWTQHAFYRADMELKVQVNSQPAQSGYLALGVMYNASEATAIGGRVDHVANIVQMPHIRISAGASNSGVIQIPFVRQFPVGCILDNNFDVPQYVCTLFVAPLLQLRTGPDGPQVVDVTVMIRFPRCEFYGQRDKVEVVTARSWVEDLTVCGDVESNPGPIGMALGLLNKIGSVVNTIGGVAGGVSSVATGVANSIGSFGSAAAGVSKTVESLLRPIFPKRDADRPQSILEPTNFYLQQNTSLSLATGTNVVKLLQLQAENMTSHPPALVPTDDQFSNRFIQQTFGIIDFVQWSVDQAAGTTLWEYDVTPLQDFPDSISTFYPTPMSALGHYYAGFHGNILLRFTFAISKFHSGRVYIVYKPDGDATYANVGSYYGVLLDVQDQSQYTFVVPYQVPTTFAPLYNEPVGWRGFDQSTGEAHVVTYGKVYVFVENQLRVMQTATPTIDILVEQAAAPNFAYVVPSGSEIRSLPTVVATAQGVESAPNVENQVTSSDERQQVETASTNVRQTFPTWAVHLNESYDIRDLTKRYIPWFDATSREITASDSAINQMFTTITVFHIPTPPFRTRLTGWGPISNVRFLDIPTSVNFRSNLTAKGGIVVARERINMNTNNTISFRVPWVSIASMLSNSLNPENGRPNQMSSYCNGRVVVVIEPSISTVQNSEGSAQYLAWDVTAGSPSVRDSEYVPDLVTLLHDAFRFTKADFMYQIDVQTVRVSSGTSLRLRCFRSLGDGGNFYVFQGFPKMRGRLYKDLNAIGGTVPEPGNLIVQSQKKWVRDLTQDGDVESNPGPVVTSAEPQPGCSKDPIPDPPAEPLTDEEQESLRGGRISASLFERIGEYCRKILGWTFGQTLQFVGKLGEVLKYVGKLPGITSIQELITTVRQLEVVAMGLNRASSAVESLTEQIKQTKDRVGEFVSSVKSGELGDVGDLISNGIEYIAIIVNIWNAQSKGMVILNIAALLSKMGLGRFLVHNLVDKMGFTARGDDETVETEYVSVIITGILTAVGISGIKYDKEGWYKDFVYNVKDFFRTGFNVKKFLDSHFRCIADICTWIKTKLFGKVEKQGLTEDLLVWCERVHRICEVYNYDGILNDPEFADDVLALQDEAFAFDRLFLASKVRAPNQYNIYRSRLQKAVDLLGQQGTMQRSKPVPFCLWIYGNSGCGKSHVTDTVLIEMGHALGLSTANAVYTRSPDVEFWNGYTGQKLISWQDFAKVTTGETYRKQVSELSSLIEPTPFNPPFAALDDKRKIADAWAVVVTSNKSFPDVQSIGMTESVLFYRRRHALVQMRIKQSVVDEYAAKGITLMDTMGNQRVFFANRIPAEDYEAKGPYFHVEFGFHADGTKQEPPTEWFGIDDFLIKIKELAVAHRTGEIRACEQRRFQYSRLRKTAPTGLEFREHVKTAREEIARFQQTQQATAQAKEKGLVNMATTLDHRRLEEFESLVGAGTANVTYKRRRASVCDHKYEFKEVGTDDRGHKLYEYEYCGTCDYKQVAKSRVIEHYLNNPTEMEGHLETVTQGTLPAGARQFSVLDYVKQLIELPEDYIRGTGLPEGYAYWSELIPECCHNKDILRMAYFELVNGKIELVIDMSSLRTFVSPFISEFLLIDYLDPRRWRAWSSMYKIILPPICEQSKFKFYNRLYLPDFEPPEPSFTPWIGFNSHSSLRSGTPDWKKPWVCNAVTRPAVSYYKLDEDVLRFLIRGTYVEVTGLQDITDGLNHLLGSHSSDIVAFCNTFFFWKLEGMSKFAKSFPFVNAAAKDVVVPVKIILSGVLVVFVAYKLYRLISNSAELTQASAQAASQSGDIRKTEQSPPPRITFISQQPSVVTAQGEDKLVHIQNSFCKISKGTLSMFGVRICNTFVLAPLHLSWPEGDYKVQIQNNGTWNEPVAFPPGSVKIARVEGYDYAIYNFASLPAAKNIVNYFVSRPQASSIRAEASLLTLTDNSLLQRVISISQYQGMISYDNRSFSGKTVKHTGWQYMLGGADCRCGSLILSNGMLCGMHVAHNFKSGMAYAVGICKEMLQAGLQQLGATEFDMRLQRTTPKVTDGTPKMQPPAGAVLLPIGVAEEPVRYSGKTNIEPSIIHGEISEPHRFPAPQQATARGSMVGYDIVMTGCTKQFNPPTPLNPDVVEEIGNYLSEKIIPNSPPLIPTSSAPLPLGTAIAGVDGIPLMSSMKLNTSIGWPLMNEYPKGHKKSDIIVVDKEKQHVAICPIAMDDYKSANAMRQKGICAPTVFMDFPKDELLKPGKDTRLINGAPLHHTLDMRRYLMEFFAAITLLVNKIAVGVDVHSGDWALVHSGTDSVVDEDYSGFGPGFHSQWMDVVTTIAVRWCKKYKNIDGTYENVIRCLLQENKNAIHVAGDLVYQVFCGSPSGAYATDRINSIANLCYHCYCYKQKYNTLTGFWSHYCLVYGDDTRREETAYTGDEFQQCMANIGIVVKRDKSGTTSFLKRQFVPLNYKGVQVMLAPLPKPIVGDILNWVRKPVFDKVDAVVETVGSYLSEIFHHGPDEYNNSRQIILELLAKFGRTPELPTFDDLFRQKYLVHGAWPVLRTTHECVHEEEKVTPGMDCRKWLAPQGSA